MVEFHSVGHKTKLTLEQMAALLNKKPSKTVEFSSVGHKTKLSREKIKEILGETKESNNG